jgi:hypothetical protein
LQAPFKWEGVCNIFKKKLNQMELRSEINRKIVLAKIKIYDKFPELTKLLDETQEHILCINHKGINNKDLNDYLDSLHDLLESYSKNVL